MEKSSITGQNRDRISGKSALRHAMEAGILSAHIYIYMSSACDATIS